MGIVDTTQNQRSRSFYVAMRRATGCPPIIAMKMGRDYYVETKDGKVRIEAVSGMCNMWEAKMECIHEWSRLKEEEKI